MIQQIIKRRYFLVIYRFVSVFLHSSKVAAADQSPPVLALYRISRSDCEPVSPGFILPFCRYMPVQADAGLPAWSSLPTELE
jgi:hypothetical protein